MMASDTHRIGGPEHRRTRSLPRLRAWTVRLFARNAPSPAGSDTPAGPGYNSRSGCRRGRHRARTINVPITLAKRSAPTCEDAGQHSVQSSVDNCYRDQAVTNAAQLAGLLNSADVPVVAAEA